jgi:hypothetical protein
MLVVRKG